MHVSLTSIMFHNNAFKVPLQSITHQLARANVITPLHPEGEGRKDQKDVIDTFTSTPTSPLH
jgi:hypothetical protein